MKKKRCPLCGSLNTKKNGFIYSKVLTSRGLVKRKTQRFRCLECGGSFTWHGHNRRKKISDEVKTKTVRDYFLNHNSLSEIAERYGVGKSSILVWLKEIDANYSSTKEFKNSNKQ